MRQKDERIKIHGAAIIEKGGEAGWVIVGEMSVSVIAGGVRLEADK